MAGVTKRRAEFVPERYRVSLDQLSKADLMEVAFSLALRLESDDAESAFNLVAQEHLTLAANMGRKGKQI
jgi:hypothetical protein